MDYSGSVQGWDSFELHCVLSREQTGGLSSGTVPNVGRSPLHVFLEAPGCSARPTLGTRVGSRDTSLCEI